MKDYDVLKRFCKVLKKTGFGNFWFEEGVIENYQNFKYRAYQSTLLLAFTLMVWGQNLAHFGHYPQEESQMILINSLTHTFVYIKVVSLMWYRELITKLNQRIIDACERIEDIELMKEKFKIMKINCIIIIAFCVGGTSFCNFEGIRSLLLGGHYIVVATIYPAFEDDSIPATITRFIMGLILCGLMVSMVVVDLFTLVYIIMYKYKFITLTQYFNKLGEEFEKLSESGKQITTLDYDKLFKGLIEGFAMHSEVLGLSDDIYDAFGTVMTSQILMSFGSVGIVFLEIALTEDMNLVTGCKMMFFAIAVYLLLAMFLCNIGDITYQASLLPNSIFHCGWYVCSVRHGGRQIRTLIQIALAQSQRPVVFMSLKMIELTYATFLSVVQMTYSVFTLIYAQR